jgi:hypothetical protein
VRRGEGFDLGLAEFSIAGRAGLAVLDFGVCGLLRGVGFGLRRESQRPADIRRGAGAGAGEAPDIELAGRPYRWLNPPDSCLVMDTVMGCLPKWDRASRKSSSSSEAMSWLTPSRTRMRCTGMSETVPVRV